MSASRTFFKTWYRHEVLPIIAVLGVAVTGATWYCTRLLRHPEVVYSRSNPYPWQKVDQDTQLKLMTVNQTFGKKYSRSDL
ncbi:hypothetical protein BKA69DRAFT_1125810 [Paraphysoderma sedebokerense]|nr:hypothetical protein BKA69DRAFT_1125810 [Paraphysoderma sedebokerense]